MLNWPSVTNDVSHFENIIINNDQRSETFAIWLEVSRSTNHTSGTPLPNPLIKILKTNETIYLLLDAGLSLDILGLVVFFLLIISDKPFFSVNLSISQTIFPIQNTFASQRKVFRFPFRFPVLWLLPTSGFYKPHGLFTIFYEKKFTQEENFIR